MSDAGYKFDLYLAVENISERIATETTEHTEGKYSVLSVVLCGKKYTLSTNIKSNFYIFNLGRRFTRIYTDLISSVLICVNLCQ